MTEYNKTGQDFVTWLQMNETKTIFTKLTLNTLHNTVINRSNPYYHEKAGRRQRAVEEFIKKTCYTANEPMMMMNSY